MQHGATEGRDRDLLEFDHSYADTVAELGYPTRTYLRNGLHGIRRPL